MAEQKKDDGESAVDMKALVAKVNEMSQALAVLGQRNQELEAAATGGVLPMEDQPVYEIINNPQGFFSPDCVFYPEGAQFVDLTGALIPNETFLPLNRAAEIKMDEYLRSRPNNVRTPPMEYILEASYALRDMEGNRAEYALAAMQKAIELATKHGAKIQISDPITRPVKQSDVPLMTNSRLNGVDRARSASATRYRGEGAGPADKAEPAMTGGRNELLGRFAPPRVRAG